MLVYLGPYRDWFGPYQFARLLRFVGVSLETCDRIAEKLPERPFLWLDSFRKRQTHIEIHRYDTWSMDNTLSLIIHPMLLQLKKTKHGSPFVDDEDVPEAIRSTNAATKEFEWSTDEFHHDRWDYVLDEMIWTFSVYNTEWDNQFLKNGQFDFAGYKEFEERMQNGLRLFGKYYSGLWD